MEAMDRAWSAGISFEGGGRVLCGIGFCYCSLAFLVGASDATYGDGRPPRALVGTAPAVNAELGNGSVGYPAGFGATTPTGASENPQAGSSDGPAP